MRKLLGILAVLALASTGTALASQAPTKAKPETTTTSTSGHAASSAARRRQHLREASGTVAFVNATRLVVSQNVKDAKGKDARTTFVLTPETQREGRVTRGEQVIVEYRMENNERVAALVKVTAEHRSQRPGKK